MSTTSIGSTVIPHAILWFAPRMTPGAPAIVTPATFIGPRTGSLDTTRCTSYQIDGVVSERCGSLASIALPVALCDGPMIHQLLPTFSPRSIAQRDGQCDA